MIIKETLGTVVRLVPQQPVWDSFGNQTGWTTGEIHVDHDDGRGSVHYWGDPTIAAGMVVFEGMRVRCRFIRTAIGALWYIGPVESDRRAICEAETKWLKEHFQS